MPRGGVYVADDPWRYTTSSNTFSITVANPPPPKPQSQVDLLLADVERVCKLGRGS